MIKYVIAAAAFAALLYVLYVNGLLVMQSKSAKVFTARNGLMSASFKACSGWVSRVYRFKNAGTRSFRLEGELSSGSVTAEILGSDKKPLVSLCVSAGGSTEAAGIMDAGPGRYYLKITFADASGSYRLSEED